MYNRPERTYNLLPIDKVRCKEVQNVTYTLYADLFFLENIVMNYIIISAASLFTNKILSIKSNPFSRLLGSIIGESVGEDLVNTIFSDFCMGK